MNEATRTSIIMLATALSARTALGIIIVVGREKKIFRDLLCHVLGLEVLFTSQLATASSSIITISNTQTFNHQTLITTIRLQPACKLQEPPISL